MWNDTKSVSIAQNGFRACGIYPVNFEAIPEEAFEPSTVTERAQTPETDSDDGPLPLRERIGLNQELMNNLLPLPKIPRPKFSQRVQRQVSGHLTSGNHIEISKQKSNQKKAIKSTVVNQKKI